MSQEDGYEKLACRQVVGVNGPASGDDGPDDESDAIEDAGESIWWGGSIDMSEGISNGRGPGFSNIPW